MISNRIFLIVNGRASDDLSKKLFGISCAIGTYNIVLFCDYSEFDIPIETSFNHLYSGEIIIFSGVLTLKKVTQQFSTFMSYLPSGWQTICLFELNEKLSEGFKVAIPEVHDWYSRNKVNYKLQ